MDEESYPKMSVAASEQSTSQVGTSPKSKEDNLTVLKAGNEATALNTDAHSVAQRHLREVIEEQTQKVLKQPGDSHKHANKKRRVLCDSMQVLPHNDQECNYAKNCSYVPMNVEEVSVVKSLKLWTNPNVRVIGKFVPINSNYTLSGVGEDQGEIYLNIENLDQYPKHGDIVEVFGTLCIDNQYIYQNADNSFSEPASQIKLKVMFCRSLLDVPTYKKGLSLVKPYIPLFVRRN